MGNYWCIPWLYGVDYNGKILFIHWFYVVDYILF